MNSWRTRWNRQSVDLRNKLMKRVTGSDRYTEPLPTNGFKGGGFGGAGYGTEFGEEIPIQIDSTQYIRRTPIPGRESFSSAFNRARTQGEPTFIFNGEEYTTEISDNPQYVGKRYQDTIDGVIREVLDENMKSIPDSTRIEPYVGQMLGVYKRNLGGVLKSQIGTKLLIPHKDYLGVPYKQDGDYNYYEAYPEDVPPKSGEHWRSRNPVTGKLLKSEIHPTFDLMIKGEKEANMNIYQGLNEELYSYPKEQIVPFYLRKFNYGKR